MSPVGHPSRGRSGEDNQEIVLGIAQIKDNNPTHIRKAYRAIEKQQALEENKDIVFGIPRPPPAREISD